jgi:hypothetical protein
LHTRKYGSQYALYGNMNGSIVGPQQKVLLSIEIRILVLPTMEIWIQVLPSMEIWIRKVYAAKGLRHLQEPCEANDLE